MISLFQYTSQRGCRASRTKSSYRPTALFASLSKRVVTGQPLRFSKVLSTSSANSRSWAQ